jgi:photosystem II stability/assembly factor-like uncharacterized protein
MKYLFFLSFFFYLNLPVYCQWDIFQGEFGDVHTMDFVGDSVGWLAGNHGMLYKTEDGSSTWNKINLDPLLSIQHLNFVNKKIGWIIAMNSIADSAYIEVYRSEDGGLTWSKKLSHNSVDYFLDDIYPVNDSCVYIRKYYNQLLKTMDGGERWEEFKIAPDNRAINEMCFFDDSSGIVVGYIHDGSHVPLNSCIRMTNDGASSWQEKIIPEFRIISYVQFINDSTYYFLVEDYNENNLLCKTENLFETWSILCKDEIPRKSFYFIDEEFAYAQTANKLIRTIDGGANWDTLSTLDGWQMLKAVFINKNIGYIVSRLGWRWGPASGTAFLKTADGGNYWAINKIFSYNYNDLSIVNENKIFIAGGQDGLHYSAGDIFATDSEFIFFKQKLYTGEVIACEFLNNFRGFALSRDKYIGSYIYKTEDSGENWEVIFNGTRDDSSEIQFNGYNIKAINENKVWALGQYDTTDHQSAAILETNDIGENWEYLLKCDNGWSFFDACIINDSTAWVVGSNGLIVKYNVNNQWQLIDKLTDLPLHKVCFIDFYKGWISGGYQSIHDEFKSVLLHTDNAGETWIPVTPLHYLIYDIYFDNTNHGWFVGCDSSGKGVLLETTGSGDSLSIVVNNLSVPLRAIDFKDELGIIVGGGVYNEDWDDATGIILRTANGGSTWIDQNTMQKYSSKFQLSQNYPNPFNPKTVIRYALPVTCHLNLSVYNIIGQKVVTLVNKKQPAGSYNVEWDASGFASGVYYFNLTAGNFQQVKKMILLK